MVRRVVRFDALVSDWSSQRDVDCRDQKVQPRSTLGTRQVWVAECICDSRSTATDRTTLREWEIWCERSLEHVPLTIYTTVHKIWIFLFKKAYIQKRGTNQSQFNP